MVRQTWLSFMRAPFQALRLNATLRLSTEGKADPDAEELGSGHDAVVQRRTKADNLRRIGRSIGRQALSTSQVWHQVPLETRVGANPWPSLCLLPGREGRAYP